jgi:sec-independent protein translocase protein TatC
LNESLKDIGIKNPTLVYTHLAEAFLTYVKVSFFAALMITFPFFEAQLWLFLKPGLHKNERKLTLSIFILAPLFFIMGAALAYYYVFPLTWKFLVGFSIPESSNLSIHLMTKMEDYFDLATKLLFAFGLCFQLPLILVILAQLGIVSSDILVKNRKFVVVGVFILAALLTPPDVLSQIALAIPLLLLYELSIIIIKKLKKK